MYLFIIVYYQQKRKLLILTLPNKKSFHPRLDPGIGEDDLFSVQLPFKTQMYLLQSCPRTVSSQNLNSIDIHLLVIHSYRPRAPGHHFQSSVFLSSAGTSLFSYFVFHITGRLSHHPELHFQCRNQRFKSHILKDIHPCSPNPAHLIHLVKKSSHQT